MTFQSVLVANRGEIARRIIRGCREAGLRSIAVYSDADVDADFVLEADTAIRLGPTPAAESYLSIDKILAAAKETGAGAIHPGYGFLSERAEFAQAVEDAGLVFIGPSAQVMELMGRKDRAREVAVRAGVPVTPQFQPDSVPADAYPVLVKSAAGGGGKGMHIVHDAALLESAIATAKREASAAFGDDTLLIEKYVEGGRHVEVQVFGDRHGNVVHLFERDCSAQRRHQKVIEEAPAPHLPESVRATLLESSVALCREVGYVNAGTVEFLVAGDEAYFLEMNTRLQVEHPVTEEITGIDLVQWQFAVAAGQSLPLEQHEISVEGHAIEVRIYAEDPYAGFLPQAGAIAHLEWGDARVESAFEESGAVTTSYDPMIAKLIVAGADRDEAREELLAAIDDSAVLGLTSNLGFLRRLADSPAFATGSMHTGWLDSGDADELLTTPPQPAEAVAAAAKILFWGADIEADQPFGQRDGWRVAGPAAPLRVPLVDSDGELHRVELDDDPVDLPFWTDGRRVSVSIEGQSWDFEQADATRKRRQGGSAEADVLAPMPGAVLAVDVDEGESVISGQTLGTMEAMKMELALQAPYDGVVAHVGAQVGEQVGLGQVLFTVDPMEREES